MVSLSIINSKANIGQFFIKRQFSVSWMSRHIKDQYVKQAVAQDMRSRSAFKLTEILDTYKFISPTDLVLDLGAAPGGFDIVEY